MKKIEVKENVDLLCSPVPTFPNGINEAFDALAEKFPPENGRSFFGISYMNDSGKIIYKVAAQKINKDEGKSDGYEKFTLPKGEYLSEKIEDWKHHLDEIASTFQHLMKESAMDMQFPCIEWYKTREEMLCMVKAKENNT